MTRLTTYREEKPATYPKNFTGHGQTKVHTRHSSSFPWFQLHTHVTQKDLLLCVRRFEYHIGQQTSTHGQTATLVPPMGDTELEQICHSDIWNQKHWCTTTPSQKSDHKTKWQGTLNPNTYYFPILKAVPHSKLCMAPDSVEWFLLKNRWAPKKWNSLDDHMQKCKDYTLQYKKLSSF